MKPRTILEVFFFLLLVLAPRRAIAIEDNYHEALTILTKNCAGCHQAADHPGRLFLNKAGLSEKETLDLMIQLVETSQMPPAHRDFKKTEDGQKLLKWLKHRRTTEKSTKAGKTKK